MSWWVRIYTYVYVYIYVYIYIYICVCVCVCTFTYLYMHTHTLITQPASRAASVVARPWSAGEDHQSTHRGPSSDPRSMCNAWFVDNGIRQSGIREPHFTPTPTDASGWGVPGEVAGGAVGFVRTTAPSFWHQLATQSACACVCVCVCVCASVSSCAHRTYDMWKCIVLHIHAHIHACMQKPLPLQGRHLLFCCWCLHNVSAQHTVCTLHIYVYIDTYRYRYRYRYRYEYM